ncbi:hypothetical protein M885DRAFT_509783 [Pelagophyceae sp. CCMP2097]|nr:hypothetical protein M885DRAFT_509783 [Pelagophyceae sp. CCMP2097]
MFRLAASLARRPGPLLAAGGAALGGAAFCDGAPGTRVERATGVEFDEKSPSGLRLRGAGCRYKYGFAKVYAVALYTPSDFVLKGDDVVRELSGRGARELKMTLVRDLDMAAFVKALEEQLVSRVVDKAQTTAFVAMCEARLPLKMREGFRSTIRLDADGTITLVNEADPSSKPGVLAPQVCDAFLDMYLGPESVSPSARADIIKGLRTA